MIYDYFLDPGADGEGELGLSRHHRAPRELVSTRRNISKYASSLTIIVIPPSHPARLLALVVIHPLVN